MAMGRSAMTLPGPRDWLFSVKTFAGAMLERDPS
jgi:hypothetical protein